MKKILAILLCAALLLTGVLPAAAAESNMTPNQVIQLAKNSFSIPADFDVFHYDMQADETSGLVIYYLKWAQTTGYATIEAAIDENGYVYSYYYHDPERTASSELPALSRKEAVAAALSWAQKIFPDAADEIAANRAAVEYNYGVYEVSFDCAINGVRAANSMLRLSIEPNDGRLLAYVAENWPVERTVMNGAVINAETAKQYLAQKLPMTLQYASVYDEATGKNKTILVYAPPEEYDNTIIDARTGDLSVFKRLNASRNNDSTKDGTTGAALTERELAEITKHNALWTPEALLAKMDTMSELDRPPGITASTVSASKVTAVLSTYSNQVFYRTGVDFTYGTYGGQYASFDAETGELVELVYEKLASVNPVINMSEADARQLAESFLRTNKNAKFSQTFLKTESTYLNGGSYFFRYIRQVNGVPFYSNYIEVVVDAEVGKIIGLSEAWNSDAVFESTSGAIGVTAATNAYFNFYGSESFYFPVSQNVDGSYSVASWSVTPYNAITLFPAYAYEFDSFVEAKTGKILTYTGEKVAAYHRYTVLDGIYPQLEGHWSQAITLKLYDAGIMLDDPNFDPNAIITVGEFQALLRHWDYKASDQLGSMGANATLIRMNAIRYLIDAMGFGRIAQNASIFRCSFADEAEIGAANIGYTELAKTLGIAVGSYNNFMPNKTLSNAEALVLVYNCLTQQ